MNKKLSVILIILIFGFAGIMLGLGFIRQNNGLAQQPSPEAVIETSTQKPAEEKPPEQPVTEPQTISIPKINVKASVELVGQDSQGRMDVPKGVFNVGWYSLGYKPGEKGSAVMAGHLDTVTGAPAVFYYLSQLQPGDQVIVTDKNGKDLTFEVTDTQSYPFNQVPLETIFNSNDKSRLNLITCMGTWDIGSANYSNRLVIYTELKT